MTQEEAIKLTQQEVKEHAVQWQERFYDYLRKTNENKDKILERRKKFHKWGNLTVYSTIGRAKDDSNYFDLRYEGQSVGQISVSKKDEVKLHISSDQYNNNCNEKYLKGYPKEICKAGCYKWHSDEAKAYRAYFKTDPGKEGHPEHRLENLLLTELSKSDGKCKSFKYIQPITLGKDLFFQMPTPLTASGKEIKYSEGHGGIDILARRKEGNESYLTVFELKDDFNKTEGPDKVICQAIAYATFLVELCETKARAEFIKLCGLQKIEKIYVSILMPEPGGKLEPDFKGKVLVVPGSTIKLVLHYTFFDKKTAKVTRSSLFK